MASQKRIWPIPPLLAESPSSGVRFVEEHHRGTAPTRSNFPKAARLLKRAEFVRTQDGRKTATPLFLFFFLDNGVGFSRLGVTVSKRVGNAVKRNRVKRLIREVFRVEAKRLATSVDCVVIARKKAALVANDELMNDLRKYLLRFKRVT